MFNLNLTEVGIETVARV